MFKSIFIIILIIISAPRSGVAEPISSVVDATTQSKLSLNVIVPTCLPATVENVSLGSIDAGTILSGEIDGYSTLSIDCTGAVTPENISLIFEPADPHLTMGQMGYISSKNTSIGYLLSWADNKIGTSGTGIPMKTEVLLQKPEAAAMRIKFKIKPVSLPIGSTSVKPGNANTHIMIKIKYS